MPYSTLLPPIWKHSNFIGLCIILLLCLSQFRCARTNTMSNNKETSSFAQDLVNRKFGDFFVYPMHTKTIDKIWEQPNAQESLDQVLQNLNASTEAKFLSCEVFFSKDILFMQRHAPEKVAEIYTQALVNNYTGMANSWGLLYKHQDEGPTGIAFLTIGKKAIPALTKLLDDDSTPLSYHGSGEATVGNGYNFRIKDFAAYYIGRILGSPLQYYSTNSERDAQIEALKKTLAQLEK